MSSLQLYLRESRRRLSDLDTWTLQLYEGSDVAASIAAALQGLRRDAGFMGIAPIVLLVGALEDFFSGIRETGGTFSLARLRLVQSCLSSLKEGLDALESEGSCQMDAVDGLVQTLGVAAVQDSFAIKGGIAQERERGWYAAEPAAGGFWGASMEVSAERLSSLFRSFDMVLSRQVQLQASMDGLTEKLGAGELDSLRQVHWPLVMEGMESLSDCILALQEQLTALQHLPLQGVLEEVSEWAAGEARELGKKVQIEVPAVDIHMDGQILRRLPGILMSLVGMVMRYGIEDAEERLTLGKSEAGRLWILARSWESRVVLTIQDDGRGMGVETVTWQDLSGFLHTRELSADETGWDGLSAVLHEVDRLGGSLRIGSQQQGSFIEMTLPISLSFREGVCVRAGGRRLVVLAHYIQEILTVDRAHILQSNGSRQFVLRGELVPVYNLAMLLDKRLAEGQSLHRCTLMVILYLDKRWALEVDELLYRKTVLAKSLPPLLRNLEALQGLVLDGTERLIPIVHIPSILPRFQQLDDYTIRSFEVSSRRRLYSVLVVEDSAGTSLIERLLLEQAGYRVDTAGDGIEALDMLKSRHYDLVVTDIHMPRMDGFVLIKNLRRMDGYQDVPVVVVSAVTEEGMMERVVLAGGQAFISKPHFQRERLVSIVEGLLHG